MREQATLSFSLYWAVISGMTNNLGLSFFPLQLPPFVGLLLPVEEALENVNSPSDRAHGSTCLG